MKKSNYIYYLLAGIVGLYIYKKIYPLYKDLKGNPQLPQKKETTTLTASGEILNIQEPLEKVDYKVKYAISGTRKKCPTQI